MVSGLGTRRIDAIELPDGQADMVIPRKEQGSTDFADEIIGAVVG